MQREERVLEAQGLEVQGLEVQVLEAIATLLAVGGSVALCLLAFTIG